MERFAASLRQHDAHRLVELICLDIGSLENWIVQGLPQSGIETVFNNAINLIEKKVIQSNNQVSILTFDLSQYWMSPISTLVNEMCSSIPATLNSSYENGLALSDLLGYLKRKIVLANSDGLKLVYVFKNFDSILKFQDRDGIQHLLNVFQSVCSSSGYQTVNIIQCYRDIEDICQATNFSDYYKIFGTNHFRVTQLDKEQFKIAASNLVSGLSESGKNKLTEISGGCPEHADVVLRFLEKDSLSLEAECLDALNLVFQDWDKILSPEEKEALNYFVANSDFSPEHQFGMKKLSRKGIMLEIDGKFSIGSPLYFRYLTNKTTVQSNNRKVFIRSFTNLMPLHRDLLEDLFRSRYYLEWKYLQAPTTNNATVYYIYGEDKDGAPYRPCIVKIDKVERSASEKKNLVKAIDLLGSSLVPGIAKCMTRSGYEAIVMEYASADNRTHTTSQFANYYHEKTSREIAELLNRVLGQALFPLYRTQEIKPRALRKIYFLPIPERGEADEISKIAQKSCYYDQVMEQICIPEMGLILPNPGELLKPSSGSGNASPYSKLFGNSYPFGLCLSHGDLNPRNFLIDGVNNIHLIDFTEMKPESPRFKDFTRIEAEIKFKLVEINKENFNSLLALEFLLAEAKTPEQLKRIEILPLNANTAKLVTSVSIIRSQARRICMEDIGDNQFYIEYMLGLLAQTLRIAIFKEYVNELQQEFAVLSAAFISHRLLGELN
jgi:hypothetical protein